MNLYALNDTENIVPLGTKNKNIFPSNDIHVEHVLTAVR